MTMTRKRKRRREWFWGEHLDDEQWHVFIGNREIAAVGSRQVAEQLIDKLSRTARIRVTRHV